MVLPVIVDPDIDENVINATFKVETFISGNAIVFTVSVEKTPLLPYIEEVVIVLPIMEENMVELTFKVDTPNVEKEAFTPKRLAAITVDAFKVDVVATISISVLLII